MQQIVVTEPGGPERMTLVDAPTPTPGPGEVLVAIAVSGVNYIDVYFRSGVYKSDLPIVLGSEAAGTVAAVATASPILLSATVSSMRWSVAATPNTRWSPASSW